MKNTMGGRLRAARMQKGLKLVELAKIVHSKPQVIGDYERNRRGIKRPDTALLVKISRALNVSIDYIFLGKEEDK